MIAERLDIDRKIELLKDKEPSCRELREKFRNVEIQRRTFLKDIDKSMNRFKAKYDGYIQHAANRRRSVHSISCSDSIEAFNQRRLVTDQAKVRHSMVSVSGSLLSRRYSDQPELINTQVQGKLLFRRRSTPNHSELREKCGSIGSITTESLYGASRSYHSITEKNECNHRYDITKERCSVLNNSKKVSPRHTGNPTRRHSEPELSQKRNDVDNKVRHKSEIANPKQLLTLEYDNEKENEINGDKSAVDLTSSRLCPGPDTIAENEDGGEKVESKDVRTTPIQTSKWARVKDLTVTVEADARRQSQIFDVTLKLCPKIKKRVEFKNQSESISQKAVEEIKPKWQLLRRKSIIADQPRGPERVSVNDLETICPKMEDNELEMNTLKSLLHFRKGHKKVEIVARLLNDHIRTGAEPSLNLKEGAWAAALSTCRYLR